MQLVAEGCPHLQELYLVDCNQIKDAGLKCLTRCDQLEVLDCDLCAGFTDAAVMHIAKRLKKLRKLHFGGCRQVTNASVSSIAEHTKKRLACLSIAGNPNVTDFDIEDLAAACGNLEELDLRACARLTDGAAAKLGKMAAGQVKRGGALQGGVLRRLDVGGCRRFTDKGLRSLSHASFLEEVDLRGLEKLSAHCLVEVLGKLTRLKKVNVVACTSDPVAVVAMLRQEMAAREIQIIGSEPD